MRVLVIPDIHMKTWIFDRAEEIIQHGKADMAVCLMDIADDWNLEDCLSCYGLVYERAKDFAKAYPSTLWCYGNHDISYRWGKKESGYSTYAEMMVIFKLEELEYAIHDSAKIAFIHRIDKVLFSHGGLTTKFVRRLDKSLVDAEIDEVIAAVNRAPKEYLWNYESPLWLRPQMRDVDVFRNNVYKQVVGHTPVKEIFEKDGIISTDVFSTYPSRRQIGESAMIVINTENGTYVKVEV